MNGSGIRFDVITVRIPTCDMWQQILMEAIKVNPGTNVNAGMVSIETEGVRHVES